MKNEINTKSGYYHNKDSEIITIHNENCVSVTVKHKVADSRYELHQTVSLSTNDVFKKVLSGEAYKEANEMLITAVNNRTKERDYFRLYCELLDGSITEEEFMEILDNNEHDFIVDEDLEPSVSEISLALRLAKRLRGVESINDLSALFSFNPDSLEKAVLLGV